MPDVLVGLVGSEGKDQGPVQNVVAESTRAVPQGYEEPVKTGGGAHSIICRH